MEAFVGLATHNNVKQPFKSTLKSTGVITEGIWICILVTIGRMSIHMYNLFQDSGDDGGLPNDHKYLEKDDGIRTFLWNFEIT